MAIKRFLAVVALATLGWGAIQSAPVASATTPDIEEAAVVAALSTQDRPAWTQLSPQDRARTVKILADPEFGNPARASILMSKYPELRVIDADGVESLSVVQRTRFVEQSWKIFGISYASIRTTITFRSTENQVDSILNCFNSHYNPFPGIRSITGSSYSSYNGWLGQATCKTDWVLHRLVGGSSSGTQGLRVDGYGVILQRWSL